MKPRIPNDAWVVVCDARKALFLRDEGDEIFPNLKVEQTIQAPTNPSNAEQGADRPGQMQNAVAPSSATDATDRQTLAELRFAEETMRSVEAFQRTRRPRSFILVAPPRMLAALREYLTEDLRSSIIAEIGKDLTKHPISEIEHLLIDA